MSGIREIADILAIRFARLGDVALLLPALAHLKDSFPHARLTLMTGSRTAPLARLCPWVDEVFSVDRLAMRDGSRARAVADLYRLVREVRSRRFDLVVDFHSFRETNLLCWASRARYRIGMKRADRAYLGFSFNLPPALEDKSLHVAAMFERVVEHVPTASAPWTPPPGPHIRVPPEAEQFVDELGLGQPIVSFYVGASVESRRWSSAGFAEAAKHAAGDWGADVVVLAGASREEVAIASEVEAVLDPHPRIRVLTGLDIARLAGVIARSRLLVSNDTGPMHLGPALGVPTLGIFSRSLPEHYRPIGPEDRFIRKRSVEEVSAADVAEIMDEMWG